MVIKEHKSLHCPNRLVTCKNCDYYNTFTIVTEKHYPICPQSPIDCPNHCQIKGLIRYQLEQHFNICTHQLLNCPETGCSVRLPRVEMKLHKVHVQQHNTVLKETDQEVANTPAIVLPQYLYSQAPMEFIIPNFQEVKFADAEWKSPLLFTHEKGYKFRLEVNPNGWGSAQGSHVSVYFRLMKGEYDSDLVWPFEGDVDIELLNWRDDNNHHLTTVHLNRYTDHNGRCNSRVTEEEHAPSRLGTPCFISHSSLNNPDTNTEYLQDDCLRIRVVDVAVYSTSLLYKTPSWQDLHTATQSVCDFTLTEFTKRKQFNNVYYSPPFYTHPHGYKLCIKVYVNGHGESKDTHISIFASLMRGDYDNSLQWPFEGDIVVKLLNWREDNHHYLGDTIVFNRHNDTDGSITSHVTEREYASGSLGQHSFISHSSLLYNPDTNTEYLQDDCLRLRVVDVAVYSNPLLSKIPSWQDSHTSTQSVCDFTLTEFTKRKQFNNVYYSPPFYSHPHGYKLCLRVCANGDGKGEGTHLTIFACLMRGDYDNNLQWPFEGDIVVDLLNWKEDNHHYRGDTISLNRCKDPDGSITSCVTEGECAPKALGARSFISLLCNPETNTEYLQDDCLRLRVVDVAVYSTPLLSKTPYCAVDKHTAILCDFTLMTANPRHTSGQSLLV